MIKRTFKNLPEQKRQRIISAVKEEYCSYLNEKISINRIIKRAQISRGSFYQYFDDKSDLVDLVLIEMYKEMSQAMLNILNENGGDIFNLYSELFVKLTNMDIPNKNRRQFNNMFENIRSSGKVLIPDFKQARGVLDGEQLLSSINTDGLRTKTAEELNCLNEILISVTKECLYQSLILQRDKDEVHRELLNKLELIKTGTMEV